MYYYIPYITIKLIKGRLLASLSLVDRVNLVFEEQILSVEKESKMLENLASKTSSIL